MQKGPVGLPDNVLLSLANLVSLFHVRNSPGLLDLAQFFKAIIETLAAKKGGNRSDPKTKTLGPCPCNSSKEQWRGGDPNSP